MRFFVNIIVGTFLLLVAAGVSGVQAQDSAESLGVASYAKLTDTNVQDGSIAITTEQGFSLSTKQYERSIIGVVVLRPAILFDLTPVPEGSYPIVTSGQASVLVNGENGPIKRGDLITTSSVKGIGMKATKSGYVLGFALEDYAPATPTEIKKITVNIKIYLYTTATSVGSALWDVLNLSSVAAAEEPLKVFRYIMAGLVMILSLILGFMSFARMASRGVEALGRNPLASRRIQTGIVLNVIITLAIIAGGVIVSVLIVRF